MNVTTDPSEVGLDAARLAAMDRHFARYVDSGRLAGWQVVVSRRGQVAHASTYGLRDLESGAEVTPDTLWRIYSMTKPITSVAAMMLWEEGRFELTDEISKWLPEFADVRVFDRGSVLRHYTVPAVEPIRMWHLFTHTAGLTYGFHGTSVVDALYRAAGYDLVPPAGVDLATAVRTFAGLPLLFQPGTAWAYSVATDVLGRIIEVISGQALDEFIAERILDPLGMADTRWWVEGDDVNRLAALYAPDPATGRAVRYDELGALALDKPGLLAGGAGLVSTAADYHRFTQMLLREGELDGVRLLGSRTVRFMTTNHLPGGSDIDPLNRGGVSETTYEGVGFGLGFGVLLDPVPSRVPGTPGSYYWGGAASTTFWIDPAEELTYLFFTQLMPSSTYPLRNQLRQFIYSALR
ncbi:MAG TPA: serine hydrolase domain-containing protein [Micromonosporaceae bacterium]|nr:serine hydrolase domain-containing protein [Micromonosporaceae bacterium]